MLCCATALSCRKRKEIPEEVIDRAADVMECSQITGQVRPLISHYFTGSPEEARSSLLQEEKLLNQVQAQHARLDDYSAAKRTSLMYLRFVYGRLLTLEVLDGNTNAAAAYFAKFKSLHGGGLSDARASSDETTTGFSQITIDGIVQFILKVDKTVNHGQEPNYIRKLKNPPILLPTSHD